MRDAPGHDAFRRHDLNIFGGGDPDATSAWVGLDGQGCDHMFGFWLALSGIALHGLQQMRNPDATIAGIDGKFEGDFLAEVPVDGLLAGCVELQKAIGMIGSIEQTTNRDPSAAAMGIDIKKRTSPPAAAHLVNCDPAIKNALAFPS